ncbi:MAG: HIT domain-containing protein [Anaerolineaceae bacterium]|nr:HIT domain-containing protein [Anaerolineaceae bacterium]
MQDKGNTGCIFCDVSNPKDDAANLVVYRGNLTYVMLNCYPYNNGHLMIVPFVHKPSLNSLDPKTRTELMEMISQAEKVLGSVYDPNGFNIGTNIGSAAGAGIADHIHFHIVPRWSGDTNFMSTLGETRVIPEDLDETCQRVREAWLSDDHRNA